MLRIAELRSFLFGLQALETEIIYGASPLPVALERAARAGGGLAGQVMEDCRSSLLSGSGITAGEAWVDALRSGSAVGNLTGEDQSILGSLGGGLGGSDRADQAKHLEMCRQGLKARLSEAEEYRKQYSRLYHWSGILAGAALVLVLI